MSARQNYGRDVPSILLLVRSGYCAGHFFFLFFFARLFKTDTSIFGTEVILGVKDIGDKKRENE